MQACFGPQAEGSCFVSCQVRANETYSQAKCQSPQKWWPTLKYAVFGLSSSLPRLVGGGGMVCESVAKADLQSDHFNNKQSREAVDLPITYHPSPSLMERMAQ